MQAPLLQKMEKDGARPVPLSVDQQGDPEAPEVVLVEGVEVPPSEWHSGTFDCFHDLESCCAVSLCPSCVVCMPLTESGNIGARLGLQETHSGFWNWLHMACASASFRGFPVVCNVCFNFPCRRSRVSACWMSTVLDTMVDRFNLPYPTPCGDHGFCDARLQMLFCGPCTLCLLARELKERRVGVTEEQAPLFAVYREGTHTS